MLIQGGTKSEVSAALSCQMTSLHGPSCLSLSQLAFPAPGFPSRDKASEHMGLDFITHQGKGPVTETVKNLPATQETPGTIPGLGRWQHTPVFLLGELHGQRTLVGYSPGMGW